MTVAQEMAAFVERSSFGGLSQEARAQLRIRILDALGCAVGALDAPLMRAIRTHVEELGSPGRCTLIGGGTAAPDRAAFHNGALVRYLDFNDSYLAPRETCHPSDNLAPVLAAAEYADRSGADLMTALAVAYQVQCRLSDEAPVRGRGFDHTTQGAYAVAAGVARALGLDPARTANAIAISGAAGVALRVTRTGALSHWKGLAYPNTAFNAAHAALLAARGVTGPAEVFEGNKGFMEAVAGPFRIAWEIEDLERVTRTDVKRFNAEVHSQSALEALLELRVRHRLDPRGIARIELDTFEVAYHIIGGGEEGEKHTVRTKEEADHSLPYLLAVALLDGEVMPAQYRPERIRRTDVQELLRKVVVRPVEELSRRFPAAMPCRLRVTLASGAQLTAEREDYEGFHTRPLSWAAACRKFEALSRARASESLRAAIIDAVGHLERLAARDLTRLLAQVGDAAGGI